jgi:cell division transport system permease protein
MRFFIKEAMRSIRRNPVPSLAAIASVLVTLIVLGVFIPVVQATTGAANEVRGRVLVDVYLKNDATPAELARVRTLLAGTPHVKTVEFVSAESALATARKRDPESYSLLGSNPLPDTFRVTPDDAGNVNGIEARLTASAGGAPVDPAIEEVKNRRDEVGKILSATSIVKLVTGILAALLLAASILLISNTVRLSLFARRREIEVMKLVGATDWYIRWPFLAEAVTLGAIGSAVAILLLTVAKVALINPLTKDFALIASPDTMPFAALVGILLLAGIGVSAAGSGLSLRRYMRV